MNDGFLFIDLDGTLLKKSTSWMIFFSFKKLPFKRKLKILYFLLMNKRAMAKDILSAAIENELDKIFDDRSIFNHSVVDFLLNHKKSKQNIYLATGANYRIARVIMQKFTELDGFIASNSDENTISKKKLQKMQEISQNKCKFTYIGNSWQDLAIWKSIWHQPNLAIVVNPSLSLKIYLKILQKINKKIHLRWLN